MWYDEEFNDLCSRILKLPLETRKWIFHAVGYRRALWIVDSRPDRTWDFAHRIGRKFLAYQTDRDNFFLLRHDAELATTPIYTVNTTSETSVVKALKNYATSKLFDEHIPPAWRTYFRLSVIATPTERSLSHLDELMEHSIREGPFTSAVPRSRELARKLPGFPHVPLKCKIECIRLYCCYTPLEVFGLLWGM